MSITRPSRWASLAAMPPRFWAAALGVSLAVACAALQTAIVLPRLWPAGHGALVEGDPSFVGGTGDRLFMYARPPELPGGERATRLRAIAPDSPAARAGLHPGDRIMRQRILATGAVLDYSRLTSATPEEQLALWRAAYRAGGAGTVQLGIHSSGRSGEIVTELDRPTAWQAPSPTLARWSRLHLGTLAQTLVFVGCGLVLLLLRGDDPTCALAALGFALCGVANAGSLQGAERILPPLLRELVTAFSWMALPLAFPFTGLAAAYFPRRSALLTRHRWLVWLPFLVVAPLGLLCLATALYLSDIDATAPLVVWWASTPRILYATFAIGLALNLAAIAEAYWRYKRIVDHNEQRRLQFAMVTGLIAFGGFAVKAGLPAVGQLWSGHEVELWPWAAALLQAVVLLPAFGITYAVAVHRVLGPRFLLRRSLQYALARGTLTVLGVLPAIGLATALVRQKDETLAAIVSGAPTFYAVLVVLSAVGVRYRDRARNWLDQRFFREEYDARRILLSLASRVRYETDPAELTVLVQREIEQALHPETIAVLTRGIEDEAFMAATGTGGQRVRLAARSGILTMLQWSAEPLDVYLDDERSTFRRLPADEQAWLRATRATLLVPVMGEDQTLVGVIVLGEKRSEEPYTPDDRTLLATIATQIGLGFDVARLRARVATSAGSPAPVATTAAHDGPRMVECPRCGRCEDEEQRTCREDGTVLEVSPLIPRVVDRKYRLERLLGKGGMGAVYRARDVRLERDVAIKIVRADLLGDAAARARFRREAQIVAKLAHPAIVAVFDYGAFESGGAYLVMEYVAGEDLRRLVSREGPLPAARVTELMATIGDALDTAHQAGVLHRDLKPENIVVTPGRPGVKLLDFGIAKLVADDRGDELATRATLETTQGMVLGTPAYMAPEQLRGLAVDARCDVFSLGVVAYELVSGRLPFGTASILDIATRHLQPPPPLDRVADVTPEFARVVEAALDSDPSRRPRTPREFAALLQNAPNEGAVTPR